MSSSDNARTVRVEYDDQIVRWFMLASMVFALVGMTAGVFIATQINFWQMNGKFIEAVTFGLVKTEGLSFLTFGRLRPLHTNAAIFAFVGNMMFAGIYYSTQRLCKTRLASDLLSRIHFWGWQAIIVFAAISLPFGFTQGKEYAELIWPIDIAVTVIWVVFAVNFFWTLAIRRERSLYVAIWFYIATIVTVAMLYIVNNLALPTGLLHSYSIYGGVQDALVQWWYGHNAVAFFLTTPILGIMYYFVPKAANRPVYSYRLSVIHFWSLVFIYIWAGPHHLLNTALPQWLQALGMLFSLMLWAPSWGGMLNGLLTLRSGWQQLLKDPVIKFFAAGVTFYGMSTFEGPLLAIKSVNALSHYTDWTIGHVHSGVLGWNGFMAAGMFYWLAPRLWKTQLHSTMLANLHFWLGMVGILLYAAAMWVSGIMEGLMFNAMDASGLVLKYPDFVETTKAISNARVFRIIGGAFYLTGFILAAYNIGRSILGKEPVNSSAEVLDDRAKDPRVAALSNAPMLFSLAILFFGCLWLFGNDLFVLIGFFGLIFAVIFSFVHWQTAAKQWVSWYDRLQENWYVFTVLVIVAAAIGGAVQIIPTIMVERARNIEGRIQMPYTPLELAGRDIYVREGCYNCHSQMIRTMVPEVIRYGRQGVPNDYSRLGESIYDFPFQWGSKRTGPDLAREGGPIAEGNVFMRIGKRGNDWHYNHMLNPRMTPGSIMPAYPWLFDQEVSLKEIPTRIDAMRKLGVPYALDYGPDEIQRDVELQAGEIVADLESKAIFAEAGIEMEKTEIIALIAYLQKIGAYEEVQAGKALDKQYRSETLGNPAIQTSTEAASR